MAKGKNITYDERVLIEQWYEKGKSQSDIARLLGYTRQAISIELKRGQSINNTYSAEYAQTQV